MTKGKTDPTFDALVEQVLDELPEEYRRFLDEVPLIVENEPSAGLLRELGTAAAGNADLCGLHWGTPLSERSVSDSGRLPDRILIFRGPVRRLAEELGDDLKRQIRVTLLHELGHHFGLDEDEIDRLGYA